MIKLILINLIILSLFLGQIYTRTSEVYSCGGFVKVHKNIDKSQIKYENIKIKLYSSTHNRLLETTECSPNGYYFLPIYDKGNYYFEIDSPEGWSFKNKRIDLNFQNENQCNEDINFELNGFLVEGKVQTDKTCKTQDGGLSGIKIELVPKQKSSSQSSLITETNDKGYYKFETVLPSEYEIKVSHSTFTFSKGSNIMIGSQWNWGNYIVKENIQVDGFDLTGKIVNENLPMKGVEFKLHKQSKGNKVKATTMSNDNGEFKFSSLECGEYILVPDYTTQDQTKYDISPKSLDVTMDTGGFKISVPFVVLGFSVSGRVVNHLSEGVEQVSILVNGEPRATTDKNGLYTLEKVSSGRVRIEAKKEHFQFDVLANHPLSAQNVKIPEIKVKSYHLCGQVLAPKPPAGVKVNPREITILNSKQQPSKQSTDNNGRFCFEVLPGTYSVSIGLTAQEKSKGLQFITHSITTTISNKPQLDVIFSQSRSTIQGKIKLLKDSTVPENLKITLDCVSRSGEETLITPFKTTNSGDFVSFSFRDLLPGTYKISIESDSWCWNSDQTSTKTVEIQSNEEIKEIEFQQLGFALDINSPNTLITCQHKIPGIATIQSLQLKKGLNQFCLTQSGNHEFEFDSCFKFDKLSNGNKYQFSTNSNSKGKVNLEIKEYLIQGKIQSDSTKNSEFTVTVMKQKEIDNTESVEVIKTIKATETNSNNLYQFDFWAKYSSEVYKFQVHSDNKTLLFYPSHVTSIPATSTTCSPQLPEIQVRKGLFMNGKVIPNIEGVEIIASSVEDQEIIYQRVLTNSEGHYSLGPLQDDQTYQLRAEKKGFNFHRKDPKVSNDFTAVELGSISVEVVDAITRKPIPGVVLSLSGEEGFRQNSNIHSVTGSFTFSSLYPGNYFLKAFLKEYSLSPTSQTVEVTEGKVNRISIKATRVAFSVYGKVLALNGLPQVGVNVQAISDKDSTIVDEYQTNNEGIYALRGLLPNQTYKIVISDSNVERSTPSYRSVVPGKEDIEDINFIILPYEGTFDLTGNFILTNNNLNIKKGILPAPIKISLQTDDTPKQTLKSLEIQHSTFFDLGSISKSKKNLYLLIEPLKLTSKQNNDQSLTFKSKTIIIEPNSKSLHIPIELEFEKSSSILSSGDNVSVPWFGLIMFVLFIFTCLYPKKVWNLILSIKNPKKSQKFVWKKKKQEDDSFLPKELRPKKKNK